MITHDLIGPLSKYYLIICVCLCLHVPVHSWARSLVHRALLGAIASHLPSLETLHLGGQPVSTPAAAAAGGLLRVHARLRVLGLRRCLRGGDGLLALTNAPTLPAGDKTVFFRHLYIKTMILPRQARDKHRENSKKEPFCRRRCGIRGRVRGRGSSRCRPHAELTTGEWRCSWSQVWLCCCCCASCVWWMGARGGWRVPPAGVAAVTAW
jgi:hypothetical protein